MSFSIQNSSFSFEEKLISFLPSKGFYNIGDIITPNSSNYSAIFNVDNSQSPVTLNLDVNNSSSNIGNILNIMITVVSPGSNDIILNLSSNFYRISNGNEVSTLNIGNYRRLVLVFTFDGTFYVSTYDTFSDAPIIQDGPNNGGVGAV
jgi:hypothetical protein